MTPTPAGPAGPALAQGDPANRRLRETAIALEGEFLAEMLKSAGLGKALAGPGSGIGEDQFASLLAREQAGLLARSGGVGIAESIYRSLVARSNDGA